jgi:hypothetical protein
MANTTITVGLPPQSQAFEPQQSFVQRLLNFQIQLAPSPANNQPNQFDTTGSNTVLLSGFRASVRIQNSGALVGCVAEVMIYGLPQDLMNQLATLGQAFGGQLTKNVMTIYAGSSSQFTAGLQATPGSGIVSNPSASSLVGFTPVFVGVIYLAIPDYNQAPDVPMRFACASNGIDAIAPASPTSFPGSVNVASAMSNFAKTMGIGFENNSNIQIMLPASYYPGTVWQQVKKMARDANIIAQKVPGAGATNGEILAIWPFGGSRMGPATQSSSSSPVPLIGPGASMIGYPSYALNNFCLVRMIFSPQIFLGSVFQLMSSIPQANNKLMAVYHLDLMLESLIPKGKWEQTASCYPVGLPAPAVPQVSSA